MKRISLLVGLFSLAFVFIFLSCEKNAKDPDKPMFLIDANNLANQTDGFYSEVSQVTVEKNIENKQHKLQLTISNSHIKPQIVKIYLEEKDWKGIELVSGQYEILFLKYALIINNPLTGQKHEFIINCQPLAETLAKLPKNYLAASAINTIGISISGQHSALRDQPGLVPGGCSTSGGTGTVSCSNACCSISCGTGYYATCANTCTCTKK
ncbi:MAG: hypothetical protein ABIN80_27370 [Dyadobacter sp.]|uniref:hypothetical protein n=1 Tax=Dyadobacter sp. TaxID=1914288 RepID=UPI003265BC44